jgi:hypothetical protein
MLAMLLGMNASTTTKTVYAFAIRLSSGHVVTRYVPNETDKLSAQIAALDLEPTAVDCRFIGMTDRGSELRLTALCARTVRAQLDWQAETLPRPQICSLRMAPSAAELAFARTLAADVQAVIATARLRNY